MKQQTIDVHKKIERYFENKEYDEIVGLVDEHTQSGNLDELMPILEVLHTTVQGMKTKSEVESLYEPLMFPSINKLIDRNMKGLASHFFEQGEGVIARAIEMKEVC